MFCACPWARCRCWHSGHGTRQMLCLLTSVSVHPPILVFAESQGTMSFVLTEDSPNVPFALSLSRWFNYLKSFFFNQGHTGEFPLHSILSYKIEIEFLPSFLPFFPSFLFFFFSPLPPPLAFSFWVRVSLYTTWARMQHILEHILVGLELIAILLPQPLKFLDYRWAIWPGLSSCHSC